MKPKQRSPLIRLLGVLILFGTFVAKDFQQEQIKEKIDRIQSSRGTLTVLKEILRAETGSQPTSTIYDVVSFKSPLDIIRYKGQSEEQVMRSLDQITRSASVATTMIDVSKSMFLATRRDFKNPIQAWIAGQGDVREKAHAVLKSIGDIPNTNVSKASIVQQTVGPEMDKYKSAVWESYQTLFTEADKLDTDADSLQSRLESEYTNWQFGGYALYLCGIIVAFAGGQEMG